MNIIYYASRNRNSRVVGANSAPLSLYKNAPVDGVSIEPVSVLIPLTRLSAHPTRDKVFLLRAVASMNLGNEAYTTARSGGPTAVRSHHHTDSHSTTALLVQLVANTCRPTIFGDDPAP